MWSKLPDSISLVSLHPSQVCQFPSPCRSVPDIDLLKVGTRLFLHNRLALAGGALAAKLRHLLVGRGPVGRGVLLQQLALVALVAELVEDLRVEDQVGRWAHFAIDLAHGASLCSDEGLVVELGADLLTPTAALRRLCVRCPLRLRSQVLVPLALGENPEAAKKEHHHERVDNAVDDSHGASALPHIVELHSDVGLAERGEHCDLYRRCENDENEVDYPEKGLGAKAAVVLLHAAHADKHHDEADFSEGKSSGVASGCEALFAIIVDLAECDGKTDDGNERDGLDDGVPADLFLDLFLFGQRLNLLL